MPEIPEEDWRRFRARLASLGEAHMPFGKYGPENYPPRGVPLYDLPLDYLQWFKDKGFPKSKLGELMSLVYEAKAQGTDAVFDELRQKAGGRMKLHEKKHRRNIRFGDSSD